MTQLTHKKITIPEIKVAGKWLFNFILIGVIAGIGSVIFHFLCELGMHYFLDMMAGYRPGQIGRAHV